MRIAVTGAFGYSGRAIATRLLAQGHTVSALTGSPRRDHPFAGRIAALPFRFDHTEAMAADLRGHDALVNTYWIRFAHGGQDHATALRHSLALLAAARLAGIGRIVHISITNADRHSPLSYFSGKAAVEDALRASGIPATILRPAVLFGGDDILLNNIAWALRRLPCFGVFGTGAYRLQPIHVEDLAELAASQVAASGDRCLDAIGPETWSYRDLVLLIRDELGLRTPVVHVPPWVGWQAGRLLSCLTGDVVITRDEITGLMEGRLCTASEPTGTRSLQAWIRANRESLGRRYHHELRRRRDRLASYARLDAGSGSHAGA